MRAAETNADVILKGTRVDGVYDSDPEKNSKAFKFQEISYIDIFKKELEIMDLTAIALCRENKLPIIVFNINKKGNLKKIILGKKNIGTFIKLDR